MIKLTVSERALLTELVARGGEATTSGNKSDSALARLVTEKYVESESISLDVTMYTITGTGRRAIKQV